MWTLVGYYTDNYADEAQLMTQSALAVGLEPVLKNIKCLGGWEENCNYVSKLIMDSLDVSFGDIVYVDVDARFKSYPVFFDSLNCDIAFHRLDNPCNPNELLGGTLFFKNTDKTKELVRVWYEECQNNPKIWTQRNLNNALKKVNDVNVTLLPVEYCAIFDHPTVRGTQPVILHTQASRRLKVKVNQRS